ncbi:MAG: DUF2207 domain-containing protein, partial [Gemmatimonadetes bacterium]|nr:DUF2207 domain-containing protein [Gemmatimonadota bacterium]NIR77291.1 DUF2207 domain-containing protein [Gemmatimonadota bacterium]NIT85809.1 DUF2207 domain-containing protein [Gemmatimonadota bacterium]NIU29635.1 DUF2207 domain-containing protein [Gemmatimonadota bacterium]NIU34682.1 DUF2207 domain-containing protein [Gemmatimonadota bacterium]
MRREAHVGHRATPFVALAATLGALWSPPGAEAQARSYHVEAFHSTIEVAEDGSIDVREQITFRFDGRFNGVFRTIPVEYRTPQGFRYHLYLDVEDVTDEGGSTLRYEESREGNYRKVKIWVPGAVDTSRTVTIRYTSPNALRFFEGGDDAEFSDPHDELYWNVTGDEWEVPIHSASAVVELPAGVTGLRAAAFTGGYGSRERAASIDTLDSGFYFETTRVLGFREGLTIAVAWDPGVVRRPAFVRKAGWFLGANWILLFPVVVTALMGWLWHTRGRDPELRSIMPHYEPPEHLAPAEVGTLVDNKPDTRDVVATLVDLAVRGYLRIEEVDKNRIHEFFTGAEYRFVRTRDAPEWTGLHDHERELLRGLFGGGGISSEVMLSDLENEFYKHLDDIKKGVFRRLMDLGLYHKRPDKVKGLYLTVGGAVAVGGFVLLQFAGLLSAAVSPTSMVVAVVGSAL